MRGRTWALVAVAVLVIVVLGHGLGPGSHDGNHPSTATSTSTSTAGLPPEAIETISLIERGGPFPYSRDGIVFGNRERLLPMHPYGYWHEYTVPTPGESDRGARRIIHGAGGEFYYTGNHYASFRRVSPREGGSR